MARHIPPRLRRMWPHLFLEPLEDRLTLSAGTSTTNPPAISLVAAPTAEVPAASSESQPPAGHSTGVAATTGVADSTASTSNAEEDEDDEYYAENNAEYLPNAGSLTNGVTASTAPTTQAAVGQSSASGSETGPSGLQSAATPSNALLTNAARQGASTTSLYGSYYAEGYDDSREYTTAIVDPARVAAANARRALLDTEYAAAFVLREREVMTEQVIAERISDAEVAASAASHTFVAAQPGNSTNSTTNGRTGDAPDAPAIHTSSAAVEWIVGLQGTGEEREQGMGETEIVAGEGVALSSREFENPPPPEGSLLAGVVPFDLDALERGVDRFFAHLDEQGRSLTGWAGGAGLTWWLAAATAGTAAFELARRRALSPTTAAGMSFRDAETWPGDPDLALTPRREE